MKRYSVGSTSVHQIEFQSDFKVLKYDDVVDRSCWSLKNEKDKSRVAASSLPSSSGSYDDPDELPSDIEVKIRSGKLDRVEVQKAIDSFASSVKKQNKDKADKESLKKTEALAKARQEYLDKATGFTGIPQDN